MKHYVFSAIFGLILFVPLMAQVPQGINYQAVVRDNTGSLQTNASLALRFSIEEGSSTIYQEVHNSTSNDYGLVNLIIGKGTSLIGTFFRSILDPRPLFFEGRNRYGQWLPKFWENRTAERPFCPIC